MAKKKPLPRRKHRPSPRKSGPARAGAHPRKRGQQLRVERPTTSAAFARPVGNLAGCRDARNHLGLAQRDFAQLIGKNDSTVETWESPNPKRRVDPPPFMQQLFGAIMHAQSPGPYELRRQVRVDGPVRALYGLLDSAFRGRAAARPTVAPRVARRPAAAGSELEVKKHCAACGSDQHTFEDGCPYQLQLPGVGGGMNPERRRQLDQERADFDAFLAENPAAAAQLDRDCVVYKRGDVNGRCR